MRPTADSHRLNGLLTAAFAGDALALGRHWIYDTDELANSLDAPLSGYLDPLPDSYHPNKRAGQLSHIGDQARVLMNTLSRRGHWRPADFERNWTDLFTGENGYDDYLDKATRHRLETGTALDSTELAAAARSVPLAAAMMREPRQQMFDALSEQCTLTHDHPKTRSACWFFAELARGLLEDVPLPDVLDRMTRLEFPELDIATTLRRVRALDPAAPIAAAKELGQSCDIEKAFPLTLYFIVHFADDLREALIANTLAGGDNCTRGLLIGMVLGALHGPDAVLPEWRDGLEVREDIDRFLASKAID